MTGLRLRPVALVAILALAALITFPALAFDLRESQIPSLEDAQNVMEYGSIVHDPLSRYIKSIDPDWQKEASVDMHVPIPENVKIPGPLGAPINGGGELPGAPAAPNSPERFGSGVPLASTGGGALPQRPVNREMLRRTLQDVNDALGL